MQMENNTTTRKKNTYTIEDLVEPVTLRDFMDTYWNKKYLYIKKNEKFFDHLLSLKDFDAIITTTTHDTMRLIKDHQVLSMDLYKHGHDKEQMIKFFNDGFSIVYESLNKTWEPLRDLCWNMKIAIPIAKKIYANAYFTPVTSMAFKRHADWQDVFILQLHGKKTWRLFDAVYNFPINSDQTLNLTPQLENAIQIKEFVLEKGDMLYVPRGMPHEVFTTDENSLHITLTVESYVNYHVLQNALKSMIDNSQSLRENVPFDFLSNPGLLAKHLFEDLLNNKDFNYDLNQHEVDLNSNLKGYFLDQVNLNGVTTESNFILRERIKVDFSIHGEECIISTRFRKVKIDGAVEEIVFIKSGEVFNAKSLPGELDDDSKLEMIKTFAVMGIITADYN